MRYGLLVVFVCWRTNAIVYVADVSDWKKLNPRCQVDQNLKVDDEMYFYS